MTLGSSTVVISLGKGFHTPSLPAYSRLLHDVLMGDRSLFTRPDGLAPCLEGGRRDPDRQA